MPESEQGPRPTSGFFRGVLFAVPAAALLWAALIAAGRALLRHL